MSSFPNPVKIRLRNLLTLLLLYPLIGCQPKFELLFAADFSKDIGDDKSHLINYAHYNDAGSRSAQVEIQVNQLGTNEPVSGATVLLQRHASSLYYGKVTDEQGRCHFAVAENTYIIRVQYTGMSSFSQTDFVFKANQLYRLGIGMAQGGGEDKPVSKQIK